MMSQQGSPGHISVTFEPSQHAILLRKRDREHRPSVANAAKALVQEWAERNGVGIELGDHDTEAPGLSVAGTESNPSE